MLPRRRGFLKDFQEKLLAYPSYWVKTLPLCAFGWVKKVSKEWVLEQSGKNFKEKVYANGGPAKRSKWRLPVLIDKFFK